MVAVLPSIMAAGGEPDAKVLRPDADDVPDADEELLYEADRTPNVVDHEPNNNCGSAYSWPFLTIGLTKGKLTSSDQADWSQVLLFRTESLIASNPKGAVTTAYALACSDEALTTPLVGVSENGWYPIRVTAANEGDTFEGYQLKYEITANDARTGSDVANTWQGAHTINALPESTNPRQNDLYKGSLPNRQDQPFGADVDWYRVNTGLAQVPDAENFNLDELNLGLLTVYFSPDCFSASKFTLFQADGATRVAPAVQGCGPMLQSCIAASFSAVYAKLEVPLEYVGTAYDFTAEVSPLALVTLQEGVDTSTIDPLQPWCDPVTPAALAAAAGASGEPWGVMDKHGRIVARVNNGSP